MFPLRQIAAPHCKHGEQVAQEPQPGIAGRVCSILWRYATDDLFDCRAQEDSRC